MASGALIAEHTWVGCPVLRTWARPFGAGTSTAWRAGAAAHGGWGCWGHPCGTEMVHRSLLGSPRPQLESPQAQAGFEDHE